MGRYSRVAIVGALFLAALLFACIETSAQQIPKEIAARTEIYGIPSLTISDQQFLTGDANGKAVTVGGEFRIATDHPVYLEWALMVMQRHVQQFDWAAEKPSDFLQRPGGWPSTRYEAKAAREGRRAYYLRYRRLAS